MSTIPYAADDELVIEVPTAKERNEEERGGVEENNGEYRRVATRSVTGLEESRPLPGLIQLPADYLKGGNKQAPAQESVPVWDVKCIPETPIDWYFERYGTTKAESKFPAVVANSIVQCLSEMSVASEFNSEKAEVKCRSEDYMTYYVRMHQKSPGETIVVEVQRFEGCGINFRDHRDSIFSAVNNLNKKSVPIAPAHERIPIFSIEELQDKYNKVSDEELVVMLKVSVEQLHEEYEDSQLYAMQNLMSMTNTAISIPEIALRSAKLILHSREIGLRDLFALFLRANCPGKRDTMGLKLRNATLQVLYNSIKLVAGEDPALRSNSDILQDMILGDKHDFFSSILLMSLRKDIEAYNTSCPHNACLATKCLTILLTKSEFLRDKFMTQEGNVERPLLKGVLKEAHEYGKVRHKNLKNESYKLIRVFEDV